MKNLNIKEVTLQDVTDLQMISKTTFLESYAAGNKPEDILKYIEETFALPKLKSELINKNSSFYFALVENQIIGYLKVNFGLEQTEIKDESSLEIQRIYVSKDFQGRRIGKLLYQKAVEIGREKGLDYIWLGVWEENPKAIQFYKNLGFIAFDQHIFQLGSDAQTDIMMKQTLK